MSANGCSRRARASSTAANRGSFLGAAQQLAVLARHRAAEPAGLVEQRQPSRHVLRPDAALAVDDRRLGTVYRGIVQADVPGGGAGVRDVALARREIRLERLGAALRDTVAVFVALGELNAARPLAIIAHGGGRRP